MREALIEAKKAFHSAEVPVGAVLVYQDQIIARAHNLVEASQDACCHAEILCLKEGSRVLGNWRLSGATLYCTLEPCSMCAGALLLSRLEALVWGAPDLRHGANGSWVDLFAYPHPTHFLAIRSGVLSEESAQLLRDFFSLRRQEGKI